ncbi:MAG: hypothetical protein VCB42_06825 [Myxococcota bacterium]
MTAARPGDGDGAVPRRLGLVFGVCWAGLVALQFGWGAPYAWGYNLWQYLPGGLVVVLLGASLGLCVPSVRSALFRGFSSASEKLGRLPAARVVGFFGIVVCLWLFRERGLYGDSQIFMQASKGSLFLFPDVGASFLIGRLLALGRLYESMAPENLFAVQAAVCLCGAVTVACVFRACAYLAPGWQGAAALLILSGGGVRVFAGHVEVYAFLLAAVAGYLWATLAYLESRASLVVPSLVLGFAIWLHVAALCLLPSLLVLPFLARRLSENRRPLGQSVRAGLLAVLPLASFLAGALLFGARDDLEHVLRVLGEIMGTATAADAVQRWNRGWGGGGSVGTQYVLLSAGHLKYLVNAAHLLSPAAAPILFAVVIARRQALWGSERARFLASACIPLGVYALVLRPVWGPFDWDLFSVTAFFFTVWAAYAFGSTAVDASKPDWWTDAYTWLVGSTVIFVTLPFLLIAPGATRDAGPFGGTSFSFELLDGEPREDSPIAPWL